MRKYEELVVVQLKEETKRRGLPVSIKNHKFTKAELINELREDDSYWAEEGELGARENICVCQILGEYVQPEKQVVKDDKQSKKGENREIKEENKSEGKKSVKAESSIAFARTYDEIVEKYSRPKHPDVYERDLHLGAWVVYSEHVEAMDGNFYPKIRRAKVVGIDRDMKEVVVETPIGSEKILGFEELLYIKGDEKRFYPKDIKDFLLKQKGVKK